MLCGWGGNRRPDGKKLQPTAGWMTYGHLQADCLYTGISSGPNDRYRVWESLYLLPFWHIHSDYDGESNADSPTPTLDRPTRDSLLPLIDSHSLGRGHGCRRRFRCEGQSAHRAVCLPPWGLVRRLIVSARGVIYRWPLCSRIFM